MPALPSAPKTIRLQYHFTVGEDVTAVCREFWNYSGTAPSPADLVAWMLNIGASFFTNMLPEFTPDRKLVQISAVDLSSPTASQAVQAFSLVGTRAGNKLPADVSVLDSAEISRRFRGGHCRVYWPAFSESDLFDAQTWLGASISEFATHKNTHDTALAVGVWTGGGSLNRVNVSFYEGFTVHTGTTGRARNVSTPRATPIIDIVVATIVRLGIATIRKRLLRLA